MRKRMPVVVEHASDTHGSQIVRWAEISRVAETIAETAGGDPAQIVAPLVGVVDELLAPHYILTRIHELTESVLAGDRHAKEELRSRVNELVEKLPAAAALTNGVIERNQGSDVAPCGKRGLESQAGGPLGTVVESALVDLTVAVANTFACEPEEDYRNALSAVVGLSVMTQTVDRLLAALETKGSGGVAAEMIWLGNLRAAGPPEMHTLSGGLPGGIPGLPGGGLPGGGLPGGGLPGGGFPGGPGRPGGPPDGGLPDLLKKVIKDRLFGPNHWDPELLDHAPIGVFTPPYIDERKLECQVQLVMALLQTKELPPPRPIRVVWSDNITAIDVPSPCAGTQAVVRGKGFGSPKPPGVVLMVPIDGFCTPLNVDPADWSDTAIRFTLPPNVTSGPVGFGDLAYITAYNAWVDRVNQAAQNAIAAASCAGKSKPKVILRRHFSECPPSTPFNHLRAGSAIIESFTVNLQKLVVAEPADALTLAWDVVNAESSQIVRTSANGPLLSGSPTLLNLAPFSSLALGPAAHTGPDHFTYVLTATGPCGIVAAQVDVVATKQPGLSISQIEVTQGIQTIPASVKFVAQKPTVVRVMVKHSLNGWGSNTVPKVVGRAKFQILGTPWSPWYDAVNNSSPMAPVPGASITVQANPQRSNTNDLLNFLIPPAYCVGNVIALVEVRVNGFDSRADFAGFNESVIGGTGIGSIKFENRHILNLRYVRLNWSGTTPTDAVCQATLQSAVPLLPTPMAIIQPLANTGVVQGAASDTTRRDALLDDFYDRHNCSAWEMATEFLGSDCPDEDDEIWVLIPGVFFRGRARDIPGNVCFTPPSDGPYAAHELSHCLNQVHLGVVCPNGQTATGGDNPGSWPNSGVLTDVPFDVSTNTTVQGSGGTVWDVMTYCGTPTTSGNNTWPSPQRWQQLWDYNGA